MRRIAQTLVFHYRAGGPLDQYGIEPERIAEIDLRYASVMFDRLVALAERRLGEHREPAERVVGCCRDFTLLFLSIARHHGWSARARVGFATYFEPGWYVDHVVAELWDPTARRWRLVEPQLADEIADPRIPVERVRELGEHPALRVPERVISQSPASGVPRWIAGRV